MPQLDSTIIFTQLFWLIFIFSSLYGCCLFFILPLIAKTLKLRHVLIEAQSTGDIQKIVLFTKAVKNLKLCLQFCEKQNLTKAKAFVTKGSIPTAKDKSFIQKTHLLLIYSLIK